MAIFNDIDDFKSTVKVNKTSVWDNWQIYLQDAQDRYLVPYLGMTIVDGLNAAAPDDKYEKVLPLVKRILGPFAVAMSADEMSINIGESGHTVTRTDSLAPASDAKIEKATESYYSRAWNNLELLLRYLEEKVSLFPEWEDSDYCKNRQTKFFTSATAFQDNGLIDIAYSRLTFEKLRSEIIRIEKSEVRELITAQLYEMILNCPDPTLKPKCDALVEKIQAYIGARVAELHTSQTTRVQRSKNNSLEFKAYIRPLYDDVTETGNYYSSQVTYWTNKIIESLPDFDIDITGGKMDFNKKERRIFNITG